MRPLFSLDKDGNFSNDKSYIIPTSDYSALALLNSNSLWFILTGMSPPVRGGFYEMRTFYIDALPIPPTIDSQKQTLATLAMACQTAAEARFKLQQDVRRRIPDLCPPERDAKLNNKLKDWWTLPDFASFQKEIKKLYKTEIPLRDRSDWEDWLNEDKTKINQLTAEIEANEDKINALVYELFELTPKEIELLEANI